MSEFENSLSKARKNLVEIRASISKAEKTLSSLRRFRRSLHGNERLTKNRELQVEV